MANYRLLAGITGVVLGLCSLSVNAAKGLTYSYGEIGYSNLNSDDVDTEGVTALLSYGATDYVHVKLDYTRFNSANVTTRNFFGVKKLNVDIDRFVMGMGGNYTLLKKASVFDAVDVFGTLSYYDAEESKDRNNSDRGYQGDAGVRALIKKKLELNAGVTRLHIDNFHDTGYWGGGVYNFYKKYSASGRIRHFSQDGTTEFFVGLRLNF